MLNHLKWLDGMRWTTLIYMKSEMEIYPEKKLLELALKVTSSCHLEFGHIRDELCIPSYVVIENIFEGLEETLP